MCFKALVKEAAPLLNQFYNHVFHAQLYDATLPQAVYQAFLSQDEPYLVQYHQSLLILASRMDSPIDALRFRRRIKEIFQVEQQIFTPHFFKPTAYEHLNASFKNYIEYQRQQVRFESVSVGFASILPCTYLYAEKGRQMKAKGVSANHPFSKAIETYFSPSFLGASDLFVSLFDTYLQAATQIEKKQMHLCFMEACQYEIEVLDSVMISPRLCSGL